MTGFFAKFVFRVLVPLIILGMVAVGAVWGLQRLGLISAFGTKSETHDSQVIRAVERTQEVSLLRLAVQGITEEDKNREVFGQSIPGTGEKVFLQYQFDAKLGINGARVTVKKTGKNTYRVSIPEFTFIGYDNPNFKTAAEDGGALSWFTPDIDKVEMIDQILDSDARQKYIESNTDALEEQTKAFYGGLISGIAPHAEVSYDFSPPADQGTPSSED